MTRGTPAHDDLLVCRQTIVTRGSELDWTGTIGMPVVLRYFEHMRWETMRDPRMGLIPEIHAGHFFVVREQVAELRRRIGLGVTLALETRIADVGRSTVRVHHIVRRADDGALVAQARVTGVWLGPERRMVRLPERFRGLVQAAIADRVAHPDAEASAELAGSDVAGDPVVTADAGTFATSFIAPPEVVFPQIGLLSGPPTELPTTFAYEHTLTIPPRDLDVFRHVNAATWLHFCDDARTIGSMGGAAEGRLDPALAADGWIVRAGLFYAREASLGDRLRIGVWWLGPRALGFACRREGDPDVLCWVRLDLAPGARPMAAGVAPAIGPSS